MPTLNETLSMRDRFIRACERNVAQLRDELIEVPLDIDKIKATGAAIKDLMVELKDYESRISKLIAEDDEYETEIEGHHAISKEMRYLVTKVNTLTNPVDGVPNANAIAIVNEPARDRPVAVKLPELSLPTFDGDLMQYVGFWQSFEVVHNNQNLSDASKFIYLRGQLRGAAKALLSRFSSDGKHYVEATNLLTETFGKPSAIREAHFLKLMNMPSPTTKLASLQEFQNTVECHVRQLISLDIDLDPPHFNHFLGLMLSEKLPKPIQSNIKIRSGKEILDLKELRLQMTIEIKNQTTLQPAHATVSEPASKTKLIQPLDRDDRRRDRAATVFPVATNNRFPCSYCNGDHANYECTVYANARARHERAESLRLCYRCLRNNHTINQCRTNRNCRHCDSASHHSSLCKQTGDIDDTKAKQGSYQAGDDSRQGSNGNWRKPSNNRVTSNKQRSNVTVANANTSNTTTDANRATVTMACAGETVALPTARVDLMAHGGSVFARAMLDQGSQRSFVLRNVANRVRIFETSVVNLAIDGFKSRGKNEDHTVVTLAIYVGREQIPIKAIVVDELPMRVAASGLRELASECVSRGLKVADSYNDDGPIAIDILIGADSYYDFVRLPTFRGTSLIDSKFGMLFSGPVRGNEHTTRVAANSVVTALNIGVTTEKQDIDLLWSLESIGIDSKAAHPDDELALEQFRESIRYNGQQYQARLPWKAEHPPLPSNYGLAMGRLSHNLKRLRKMPDKLKAYDEIMRDQLKSGFIEEVHEPSVKRGELVHYLAHHGIEKTSATTPLRVVFDCSAKEHRTKASLNDCLYSGPQLVPGMVQILLRFRLDRYAITADIRKAFLMVALNPLDRNVTRFLWPEDPQDPNSKIKTYRYKVILFGATCSQFILNATIKTHLEQCEMEDRDVAEDLSRNLYVDNIFFSASDDHSIEKYFETSKALMGSAGLQLREWATNAPNAREVISRNNELDERTVVPVLGYLWDTQHDVIALAPHPVTVGESTKRTVLSGLASQFDPLGLFAPVTLLAKLLMQDIWRKRLDWDELLPEEYQLRWTKIADELSNLANVVVPRAELNSSTISLHVFADASTKAYGAMIYGVQENRSSLIMAKSRVSPLKELTVPKLELMALVVAARLVEYVIEAFQREMTIANVHMWTDSEIALGWVRSKKPLPTFVQNRVDEINQRVPEARWHHVNTKENPADILSRGASIKSISNDASWWHGPSWLTGKLPLEIPMQKDPIIVCATTSQPTEVEVPSVLTKLVNNCGTFSKVLRVIVTVLRCIQRWNRRSRATAIKLNAPIEQIELERAKKWVITATQLQEFHEESNYLRSSDRGQCPHLVKQLHLQLRDDVIVCVSRLSNAEIPDSAKYPILLPSKHRTTELIIRDAHLRNMHIGTTALVTHLRGTYWIPHARQRAKTIVSKCITCRRQHGNAYSRAPVPPLPTVRVQQARPFAITGVDFAGPITTTTKGIANKRYIALFTCASTRAIHLELADDLSVESFIHVLHRFSARRSFPKVFISDNGTNFVGTAKVLMAWDQHAEVRNMLNVKNCVWKFIPSRAPWFGGFYERLIGMTKVVLRKTIGTARITDQELSTLLCRTEAQLNDRPLTYVSDQLNDLLPLTPSMLLLGYRLDSVPVPIVEPDDVDDPTIIDRALLTRRQLHVELMQERMWERWSTEYLTMLRNITQANPAMRIPKVGDVVMIHDEAPRITWALGRLVKTMLGPDKQIRAAKVKTSNGVLVRPILKLYPLEIDGENIPLNDPGNETEVTREASNDVALQEPSGSSSPHQASLTAPPPERRAAKAARSRISLQADPGAGNV